MKIHMSIILCTLTSANIFGMIEQQQDIHRIHIRTASATPKYRIKLEHTADRYWLSDRPSELRKAKEALEILIAAAQKDTGSKAKEQKQKRLERYQRHYSAVLERQQQAIKDQQIDDPSDDASSVSEPAPNPASSPSSPYRNSFTSRLGEIQKIVAVIEQARQKEKDTSLYEQALILQLFGAAKCVNKFLKVYLNVHFGIKCSGRNKNPYILLGHALKRTIISAGEKHTLQVLCAEQKRFFDNCNPDIAVIGAKLFAAAPTIITMLERITQETLEHEA